MFERPRFVCFFSLLFNFPLLYLVFSFLSKLLNVAGIGICDSRLFLLFAAFWSPLQNRQKESVLRRL